MSVPVSQRARLLALSLLVLPLGLGSCNDGDGQEGGTPGVSTGLAFGDFLITDAAAEELFSFRTVVDSLQLVRLDGTRTENLMVMPVGVDLLGLRERADWLAAIPFPSGTYKGVVLGFDPLELGARDLVGDPVDVVPVATELALDLTPPFEVERGSYARFLVDVDLENSLVGAVADGELLFDPVGVAEASDGSAPVTVAALDAKVILRDTGTLALSVDGFADGDHARALGGFALVVDEGTVLVDARGFVSDQPAFYYTQLVPGLTVVEVQGELGAGGVLLASRIEIEAQDGRPGSLFPVKLEGTVAAVGPGPVLTLRLRQVVRGIAVFGPALEAQDDPNVLAVSFDARTRTFDGLGTVASEAVLAGSEVELKLELAPGSPFPALRIGVVGFDDRFASEAP